MNIHLASIFYPLRSLPVVFYFVIFLENGEHHSGHRTPGSTLSESGKRTPVGTLSESGKRTPVGTLSESGRKTPNIYSDSGRKTPSTHSDIKSSIMNGKADQKQVFLFYL